jgi:hypothetical protein
VPFFYIIHEEQRLVLSIGWGRVTFDEVRAHRSQLLRDPDFSPTFNQLVDLTAITDTDISGVYVQWFASDSVFSPTSRRAAVATRPDIFGVLRQFEAYHGERARVHVFYEWDSALEWLDIRDVSCQL